MGFNIPEYLKNYLDNTKYRKPFENFVNNSTYYSQLNWQWISYMETVVRPCMAYATGSVDGVANSSLSTATGMAILRGASRLIVGDKIQFIGNDESCKFLSDIWSPAVNFNRFINRAATFMLQGGSCMIKVDKDEHGKNYLTAYRIDRTLFSVNDYGDVTNAVFFVGLLSSLKNNENQSTYWLTEERKYNDDGVPVILYKVFVRGGIANSPTLPQPWQTGTDWSNLPQRVQRELRRLGVTTLNEEIPMPFSDGLGCWLMARTSTNSCVPDSPLGDPLLYGCLDLLWSIDVVFSGSLIDVMNGEGKILVPKQFLQETLNKLQAQNPLVSFNVTTAELQGYGDESFVYVMPSGFDKDKMSPTPIQFDIRADQYGKMLEMYERMACVRAGFSPTSIFPYLTPDSTAKTATEVTAEENLTRASICEIHANITPVLNRALREILKQEGFSCDAQIKLYDYIGNKIQFDQNVRANKEAGLIPTEVAVKLVNGLTESETSEYMEKIKTEQEEESKREQSRYGNALFDDRDYYGTENSQTFGNLEKT